MDKNLDLNTSGSLPTCDICDLADNLPESDAVLKRGYSEIDASHPAGGFGTDQGPRSDSAGNTSIGDPNERGGFLNRPHGWER